MKGILLAGGLGTRLYPTTRVVNKHLLPLYDRPMFYWPLQTLILSGIKEIAIVSGPPTGEQVKEALKFFPVKSRISLTFVNQKKPLGTPDAIYNCKKFLDQSAFIVSVGDNLFEDNFELEIKQFNDGSTAFMRKVKDPSSHGVALFNKNTVDKLVEKPQEFISSWAVGAPYIFDNTAIRKIESLKLSKRNELEIVDLLNLYLQERKLKLIKRNGIWLDTGTPERLLKASLIAKKLSQRYPL